MISTPLTLSIFQVKYKTNSLEDRVAIVHCRSSDTLISISAKTKYIFFITATNAINFTLFTCDSHVCCNIEPTIILLKGDIH